MNKVPVRGFPASKYRANTSARRTVTTPNQLGTFSFILLDLDLVIIIFHYLQNTVTPGSFVKANNIDEPRSYDNDLKIL